jgi:hypothetical protein
MADEFNIKSLARSKHYHSLHKDKNKWKKKAKHVAVAKQQKEQEDKQKEPKTPNENIEGTFGFIIKYRRGLEEEEDEDQKRYSKRKVQSNEDRYKDLEEDQTDERINIHTLLEASGEYIEEDDSGDTTLLRLYWRFLVASWRLY